MGSLEEYLLADERISDKKCATTWLSLLVKPFFWLIFGGKSIIEIIKPYINRKTPINQNLNGYRSIFNARMKKVENVFLKN